jgi:hypothetical protein
MSTPYAVKPYEYVGWWELPHMDHLRRTKRMLTDIKDRVAALTALQKSHEAEHGRSYDWKPHYEEIALLKDTALAVQLFYYLAVEGFLNHYGVVRLGEDYYKANLERLGPEKKVAVILLATEGVVIPPDHRLVRLVALMFGRRNQLVHPKPKEIGPVGRGVSSRGGLEYLYRDAQEASDQVEEFYQLFSTFHTSGYRISIP